MNWIPLLVIICVAAALLFLKSLSQVGKAIAVQYLKQGAKVVDVRAEAEFQSEHLPEAINIPLGEITPQSCQQAPDKEQVLLLHCLSGTRSAMAVRTFKRMGYTRVFNLGSYRRAEKILRSSGR